MKALVLNVLTVIFLLIFGFNSSNAQWINTSNGLGGLTVNAIAVSGSYIFAGTNANGVYLSTDNCASWTQTSLNNRTIKALAVNGSNIYAGATDSGLYKSTDNGASWAKTSLGNRRVLAVAVNGSNVYVGVGEGPATSGVYISTDDGTSWLPLVLSGSYVISLTVVNNDLFAGTYSMSGGPLFKSQDNGTSWTSILTGHNVYSLAVSGNVMYAGCQSVGPGIEKSTDYGLTWSHKITISSLAVLISGGSIFSGGLDGAYISANDGTSWTQQNDGFTRSQVINDLELINGNVYAAAGNGVWKYDNTLATLFSDNAESGLINWTTGNGGWSTESKSGYYHSASNSFTDSKKANYKNNANNSLTLKNSLNATGYSNLVLSFWHFYNTEAGKDFCRVEVSSNGGTTWQEIQNFSGTNQTLSRTGIDITSYANNSNNLKVRFRLTSDKTGTADGWYVDDIKITGKLTTDNFIIQNNNNSPVSFYLSQNYPNPFNPVTKIKFDIAAHTVGRTFLSVYDILGKEVATLVSEQLQPGTYKVNFDGSNLPSGIYFYKLTTENFTDTKRMILIK